MEIDKIHFTAVENNSKKQVATYNGEYLNLMELLKDNFYVDDFGECGGVGRCSTCVVKTNRIKGKSLLKERNEPVTLAKMGYNEENVRLSCQILITDDLNGSEVAILEL